VMLNVSSPQKLFKLAGDDELWLPAFSSKTAIAFRMFATYPAPSGFGGKFATTSPSAVQG